MVGGGGQKPPDTDSESGACLGERGGAGQAEERWQGAGDLEKALGDGWFLTTAQEICSRDRGAGPAPPGTSRFPECTFYFPCGMAYAFGVCTQ